MVRVHAALESAGNLSALHNEGGVLQVSRLRFWLACSPLCEMFF